MNTPPITPKAIHATEKDLGDGLILRWSTGADKEKIAHLLGIAFRDGADEPPNQHIAAKVHIAMREDFPFSGTEEWVIVEDTSKAERPLVACICYWSHVWTYAGIPIGVGRPEFVGTDPAYRNRGLIRAIFDFLHQRSQADGHLMQAITGIPYFYRQFSYEYVLDLGGRRVVQVTQLPVAKDNGPRFTVRPAILSDSPLMAQLYNQERNKSLIWHETEDAYWQMLVNYQDQGNLSLENRPYMILNDEGVPCGYFLLSTTRWGKSVAVRMLTLLPEVNVVACMPSLLHAIVEVSKHIPCPKPEIPLSELELRLGRHHPLYDALGPQIAPVTEQPYAWYIRVPDLPAFVQRIAPILEERLAKSLLVGHTGDLKVDLYRGGLHLRFEQGKLAQAEAWRPALYEEAEAGIPALIFLQLLLGYRALDQLRSIFPDVWASQSAKLLLDTLFPVVPSTVHALY